MLTVEQSTNILKIKIVFCSVYHLERISNPVTTHFRFSADLIGRLARLDGIVALKTPSPPASEVAAHLSELRARLPDGFSLGYSGDWNAAEAMIAGADVLGVCRADPPRPILPLGPSERQRLAEVIGGLELQ